MEVLKANEGVNVSRRKAERAFTREGDLSPFMRALEETRRRNAANLSTNAQLTPPKRGRSERPRLYNQSDWDAFARKAFGAGATFSHPGIGRWDASGRCEDPPTITIMGLTQRGITPAIGYVQQVRDEGFPTRYLDIVVPCRKCASCLRARGMHWRYRAMSEFRAAEALGARTWQAILTLTPYWHSWVDLSVTSREGFVGFSQLSPRELFQRRALKAGELVTKFIKRVRKNSGAKIRYLLVTEAHQSGLPHFHLLIHESDPAVPVKHRELTRGWTYGFSNFKLKDISAASYVTKYLTKQALTRVRASAWYGRGS